MYFVALKGKKHPYPYIIIKEYNLKTLKLESPLCVIAREEDLVNDHVIEIVDIPHPNKIVVLPTHISRKWISVELHDSFLIAMDQITKDFSIYNYVKAIEIAIECDKECNEENE